MPWETRLLPPADDATAPGAADHGPAATVGGEAAIAEIRPKLRLSWWLCAAVIVGDQLAKAIVRSTLVPFDSVTIIPGLLDFIHVRNTGVAFGILNDYEMNERLKSALTTALAVFALMGISLYARHIHHHEKLARVGLSLILGGAVGNLIDRVRVGYVLDYVDVYWRGWHFWAFNIADASITIGAILVFLDLLLVTPHASHSV